MPPSAPLFIQWDSEKMGYSLITLNLEEKKKTPKTFVIRCSTRHVQSSCQLWPIKDRPPNSHHLLLLTTSTSCLELGLLTVWAIENEMINMRYTKNSDNLTLNLGHFYPEKDFLCQI